MTAYYPAKDDSPTSTAPLDLARDGSLTGCLPSLAEELCIDYKRLMQTFFEPSGLGYVLEMAEANQWPLRVVTHPRPTTTCYEKAELLRDWSPLRVIKAMYLEDESSGLLYGVVVPETGCFLDRSWLSECLGLDGTELVKARALPRHMSPGTCSPFLHEKDGEGPSARVAGIVFDRKAYEHRRRDGGYDDFSIGDNRQWSLQMNYAHAFELLMQRFTDLVTLADLLPLRFHERFIRKKGHLRVEYHFRSVDFRTASFIESVHGQGDVVVENDGVDELFVQEIRERALQDWVI